jgi:hypothetical protein
MMSLSTTVRVDKQEMKAGLNAIHRQQPRIELIQAQHRYTDITDIELQ